MEKITFVQKAVILHPTQPATFLLLIRNLTDKSRPGDYDIPGGSVKGGELHADALVREIREETGLAVGSVEPILVSSSYDKDDQKYFLYIGYAAKARSAIVTINPEEHSSYVWLTLDEFRKRSPNHLLTEQVEKALAQVARTGKQDG